MEKQSRKSFIKTSATLTDGIFAGLTINALAAPFPESILGANEKVRMGFIGVGNRGSELLKLFMQQPDCEVVALCDIYEPYLQRDRTKIFNT